MSPRLPYVYNGNCLPSAFLPESEDDSLKEAEKEIKKLLADPPVPEIILELISSPQEEIDIDEGDSEFIEFCVDYVKDIYNHLFDLEARYPVKPRYVVWPILSHTIYIEQNFIL